MTTTTTLVVTIAEIVVLIEKETGKQIKLVNYQDKYTGTQQDDYSRELVSLTFNVK